MSYPPSFVVLALQRNRLADCNAMTSSKLIEIYRNLVCSNSGVYKAKVHVLVYLVKIGIGLSDYLSQEYTGPILTKCSDITCCAVLPALCLLRLGLVNENRRFSTPATEPTPLNRLQKKLSQLTTSETPTTLQNRCKSDHKGL